MALVVIGLLGLLALVAILCALSVGWRRSDADAIGALLGHGVPSNEDVERRLTVDLLAGHIGREQYRAATAALAAAEAQPAGLHRLGGYKPPTGT